MRLLGISLTYLMLAVALLQMVGRLFIWNIEILEPQINSWLAESGVKVHGLQGRWSMLDPVLKIERLEIDGATLEQVEVELDSLESLLRNRFVTDHISVRSLHATVEKTEAGWRWPGSDGDDGSSDLWTTLRYSDYVSIKFLLSVVEGDVSHVYEGNVESTSDIHATRVRLRMEMKNDCDDCWIELLMDENSTEFTHLFESRYIETTFSNWRVHPAIVPLGLPDDVVLNGQALGLATTDGSQINVDLSATMEGTGDIPPRSLQISSSASGSDSIWSGVLKTIDFEDPVQRVTLPNLYYELDEESAEVYAWIEELDVGALAAIVGSSFGPDVVLGEWTLNLAPKGRLQDVRLIGGEEGIVLHAIGVGMSIEPYNGVPAVRLDTVDLSASGTKLLLRNKGQDATVAVEDYFEDAWSFDELTGDLLLDFSSQHVGIFGIGLQAKNETATVQVDFGLSRSTVDQQYQFGIDGSATAIALSSVRQLLPNVLDLQTREWIEDSIHQGEVVGAAMSFHTYRGPQETTYTSRFELTGLFQNAVVDYYEGWPLLEDADGVLVVSDGEVDVALANGKVMDIPVEDAVVEIRNVDGVDTVLASFEVSTDLSKLIEFNWGSQLHEHLTFVEEDWIGSGAATGEFELTLPLISEDEQLAHVVGSMNLSNAEMAFPEYNIALANIEGELDFETPSFVFSEGVQATMFGKPLQLNMQTAYANDESGVTEPEIWIDAEGTVDAADVFELIDVEPLPVFEGDTTFRSRLTVYAESDRPSALKVQSDTRGISVYLPSPLLKLPDETRDTQVQMVFHPDWTHLSFNSEPILGLLRVENGEVVGGELAFNSYPSMSETTRGEIVVSGQIDNFNFEFGSEAGGELDDRYRFDDFGIATLHMGNQAFDSATLNGVFAPDELDLRLDSEAFAASVAWTESEGYEIDIDHLFVHKTDGEEDPLSIEDVEDLTRMSINFKQLSYVDGDTVTDLGSWDFELLPHSTGVEIRSLHANLGGLELTTTPEYVTRWDTTENRTYMRVGLYGSDIGKTLAHWDFYRAIESDSYSVFAELAWDGSPLMFEPNIISGEIVGDINNGRLIDVTQGEGAIKLAGLLNFSKLLERLQLDFGDIVNKGLSFDRILMDVGLAEGRIWMREPLAIKGSGSVIRVGGSLDMNTENLDCEVIVTLPLSRSLPWYAASIAGTNPVTAVGLLIGQQIFVQQLNRMSSGKYRVQGSFEEPEVEFVGLFTDELSAADESTGKADTKRQGAGTNKGDKGAVSPASQDDAR